MKDTQDAYIPFGIHIELDEDVDAKEARDSHIAHEMRGDFRKGDGSEREYISDDSRSVQTHHITDGLTEALAIGLSNGWIKEEEDSIYSHNLHKTLVLCDTCHIWSARPEGNCPECEQYSHKFPYFGPWQDPKPTHSMDYYLKTWASCSLV